MNKLFVLTAAITLTASCGKNNNNGDCKNVACTAIFAAVTVKVQDKNGKNVALTSHYTVNMKSGDTIRHSDGSWPDGQYVVLDDNYVSKMYNQSIDFLFVGLLSNVPVVTESYTISADCCHVNKKSGPDTTTVD